MCWLEPDLGSGSDDAMQLCVCATIYQTLTGAKLVYFASESHKCHDRNGSRSHVHLPMGRACESEPIRRKSNIGFCSRLSDRVSP